MTSWEVYPDYAIFFRLHSPKIEIDTWFFGLFRTRRHALPTEDLVACDRITLYSTKFAAFIKSPLDIGIEGERSGTPPPPLSRHYLSALSLKIPLPPRPSPNFNAAHGGLWLPIFPGKRFLLEFRSPTANGEPLWWRTDVSRIDLA